MLAGEKPLAMFSDIVPSGYEWPDRRHKLRTLFFCLAERSLARRRSV